MGILENASKLSEMVQSVASEKGITQQEAWDEAVVEYKERYEESKND